MTQLKASSLIVFALLIIIFSCLFTVNEGQQALLLRLGNIVMDSKTGTAKILQPGLHFRLPLLYQVRKFDRRLQTLDIQSSRIVTAEKKNGMCWFRFWLKQDQPMSLITFSS